MVTLPVFLPLSEAARKYGLDETRLRDLIEKGKIRAGVVAGEMVVSEEEVRGQAIEEKGLRKEDLPEYQQYSHLAGAEIEFGEAARKYQIPPATLHGWVSKQIVKAIRRHGKKVVLDEQDVAYCARIYEQRKGQGKWLFDKNGLPYKPRNNQSII
jgi:predicted site-specific integrase-resolvase